MITFDDFVVHVVQTLENKKFVFLFKDNENSNFQQKIDGNLNSLDKRTSKLLGYVSKVARLGSDLPPGLEMFSDFLVNFQNVRSGEVLNTVFHQIGDNFDLNAINFSMSGVKYLACLDCNKLKPEDINAKVQYFEEAALSLRSVQGRLKPKILGLKIGRGIETDVFASLCFVFSGRDNYEYLRDEVNRIELSSTSLGARYLRGLRNIALNPMLFGNKGNTDLDKLICHLYDGKINSSSSGRRTAQRAMSLGMISYGFTPKELLP